MKKILILVSFVFVFTLAACSDNVAVDEQNSGDVAVTGEETENMDEGMADVIEAETSEEGSEVMSEDIEEFGVTDTENVDEMEEVVLEDSPITLMDTVLFAQRSVNVRSGPGTDYEKVGTLSTNQEVTVTGQDKESGWYQIDYDGVTAFVSNSYLGESKVVVSAPANNNSANNISVDNTSNTTAANNTNTQTSNTTQTTQDNNGGSSDWFTGEDMENALQFGQQFGMY